MILSSNLLYLALLGGLAFYAGRLRATGLARNDLHQLNSLPSQYGFYVVAWALIPSLLVVLLWAGFGAYWAESVTMAELAQAHGSLSEHELARMLSNVVNGMSGIGNNAEALTAAIERHQALLSAGQWAALISSVGVAILGALNGIRLIRPDMRARTQLDKIVHALLLLASAAAVLITAGIILSLVFETIRFFALVPVAEFVFGLEWSPQIALRADQVASEGAFGAVPLFVGTLLITFIAMCIAVPIGLLSAIYLTQYAGNRFRAVAKPLLEILAGIPTVVYGFVAVLVLAPAVREAGITLGLDVASESALAAGLVMGVMIIPFVSSLSDDALAAVPQAMREGSLALGATKAETITRVLIPAALPGIISAFLLALSRAIGETMIVVMAAGLAANLTANPLQAVTTVTVQIVTLLTGDQEFDSAKTLAAFALGLSLFLVTLMINLFAQYIVKTYREEYE
jgi:phosphate transport system permease protein